MSSTLDREDLSPFLLSPYIFNMVTDVAPLASCSNALRHTDGNVSVVFGRQEEKQD